MSMVKVTLRGDKQLAARLRKAKKSLAKAMDSAMHNIAEDVMADSKTNYVPVKDNALRSSGKVGAVRRVGNDIIVELGFGGAAAKYAWVQHENLDYAHKVGQAKYLEIPLMAAVNDMAARLTKHLGDAFR